MGCLATEGITSGCDLSTAGINKEKIWILNASEITAYTQTDATISDIVLASGGAAAFKLDIHKNSGIFTETLAGAENSGSSWNQSFVCRILTDTDAARTWINENVHTDLVFVVKKKNNNFEVYGQGDGLRLADGTERTTGAKAGDDSGNVLTFIGDSFETQAPYFFDTDIATTEATLDAYLTPTV